MLVNYDCILHKRAAGGALSPRIISNEMNGEYLNYIMVLS